MPAFTGTSGNDVLTGTDGADDISGLDGNDVINGGFGADTLNGGAGDDVFRFTGAGFSSPTPPVGTIIGGSGTDTIDATAVNPASVSVTSTGFRFTVGNQSFDVSHDVEVIRLGSGVDSVLFLGESSPITIYLGGGDDDVLAGPELVVYGEAGDDTMFSTGGLIADGGTGSDTFRSGGVVDLEAETAQWYGASTIADFENVDAIVNHGEVAVASGDAGANRLAASHYAGAAGAAFLYGRGGADTLSGAGGDDTLDGGEGFDVVSYEAATGGVTVNLATQTASGGVDVGSDTLVSIEGARGSVGADTLTGDGQANTLEGLEGADTLLGAGGNDTLTGGSGNDRIDGGAGDDVAVFAGDYADYALSLVDGKLTVSGADGVDTLTTVETLRFADGDRSVDSIVNPVITGTSGNDTLTGGVFNDTLNGLAGDDVLDGGAGEDRMTGGAGNDYYVFDNRGDRAIEEADGGLDTVRTRVTYSMQDNIENLVMFGTGNIGAIGNSLNNRIIGNEGNNVIKGGLGADRLEGGQGNDNYLANIEDKIIELANGGVDIIRTSDSWTLGTHFENLTLIGGSNTFGGGNARANIIEGNRGANTIFGSSSGDTLKGGDGVDRFLYTRATDSTAADPDRILDLRANEVVDLRGVDANANVAGDQAFVIVDAFTNVAGQMTITYDAASQTSTARMDINGDGVADMAIVMNGDKEDFAGWWL